MNAVYILLVWAIGAFFLLRFGHVTGERNKKFDEIWAHRYDQKIS